MTKHIRRWNIWRRNNCNGRWHKFLVLLGLRRSPTFVLTFLPEETEEFMKKCYKVHIDNTKVKENKVMIDMISDYW